MIWRNQYSSAGNSRASFRRNYLVADGASDDFRLLYRTDGIGDDVRSIRIVADAQTPSARAAVDVRLLEFTVRAERLTRKGEEAFSERR